MSSKNPLHAEEVFMGMTPVHNNLSEISSLYKPHPVVSKKVAESIERRGMTYPLIIVHRDTLGKKLAYYKEYGFVDNPEARWFTYTGNNRYYAIKQLGYESVDCVVCHDLAKLPAWEEKMYINPRNYND